MVKKYKTPGVYIDEINAFPNSIVDVPPARPVFIAPPKAEYQGRSYLNAPSQISSFGAWQDSCRIIRF